MVGYLVVGIICVVIGFFLGIAFIVIGNVVEQAQDG